MKIVLIFFSGRTVLATLAQELRKSFYVIRFRYGMGQQKGEKWVSNLVHTHTPEEESAS